MKYLRYVYLSLAIVYFPTVVGIAALSPIDWRHDFLSSTFSWNLLILFLISIPYYAAYLQFGRSLAVRGYRKAFRIASLLLAVCALISETVGLLQSTVSAVALLCVILLVVLWLTELIIQSLKEEEGPLI